MANLIVVGISDLKMASAPDTLITYALGSCVGICLYDNMRHIAGLSHILLPDSAMCTYDTNVYKFANTAIAELVKQMEKMGCSRFWMTAKIAGGANMFAFTGTSIGDRNVEAVKIELKRLNIKIIAEDTGDKYGRTLHFDPQNGTVMVKSIARGNKMI